MANQQTVRWEYEEGEIEVGEQLRTGTFFSHLFLGSLNGRRVALKLHNPMAVDAEELLHEAKLTRPLNHPNVLKPIGICRYRPMIITEYLVNGTLKQYLRQHTLTPAQCLSISHKVACALEYLHSKYIVHRDLAARSILVGETIDTIKLTDFALARNIKDSIQYITTKEDFPLRWTAPEGFVRFDGIICTYPGTITRAADVWSFAVLMWELYTNGQEPYHEVNDQDLHKMLVEDNRRLDRPANCPEVIYAKMLECWNINPEERPNISDLREFLSSMMNEAP